MRNELDMLRRDLRAAKAGLANCSKALAAAQEREDKLRQENRALRARMQQALDLLRPEGTTLSNSWDDYQEPGY